MIASTREDQVASIVQSLRNVQLLETLTDEQLHTIADAVQERAFQPGDRIISKGDEGETFYMIKSGEVVCTDIGSSESANDVTLGEGSYFGERALLLAEPRAANVVAKTPVTCMVLDRMAFTELLGPLREILDDNLKMRVVSSISVFSDLSDAEKEHVRNYH
jgi:CRP-like cAMP-binding protein